MERGKVQSTMQCDPEEPELSPSPAHQQEEKHQSGEGVEAQAAE